MTAFLFIIAALLLSVMPVYANAPAPDPSAVTLTITHPELLSKVRMILYDENGQDLHEETDVLGSGYERGKADILKEIEEEGAGKKIQFYFMNSVTLCTIWKIQSLAISIKSYQRFINFRIKIQSVKKFVGLGRMMKRYIL